ncbi:glycosyltransferase [Rahnella bruchi]|uniref:glycosyltransferase n=1 Tax=Rahnella bruchi TaxID=1510573 RepID=UPI000EA1437C|nr:glycosyltransferase [Rahnella bruchi]
MLIKKKEVINKKKILLVTDLLIGRGGMENVTSQVISAFKKGEEFEAGFFVINSGETTHSKSWLDNAVLFESVCKLRNKKLKNVIHTLRLLFFIRKYKPEHIITLNTIPNLMASRAIKYSAHKTILSTWMHLPPRERYRPHYLLSADHHFAISGEIKNQLTELGVNKNNIDVVFNPVKKSGKIILRPEQLRILYIGRVHFERQKQLKDLFDALVQVKVGWALDIVGDGEDVFECQSYAQQLGISEHITWHGWQNDPWEYVENNIKEVTCLVMTSNFEGFPLVLLEAISRGIYCVSSDCSSGPSEIIENNINGQLYPQNDIIALSKIINALGNDLVLPEHMLIKESIGKFYEDAYMNNFKNILNKITEGNDE